MASHLSLEEISTVCVKEQIDSSFVLSTGFLITSASGKVAILCYRTDQDQVSTVSGD